MRASFSKPKKRVTSHDTPWHPPVVAFRNGSTIREAYAQWWQPHHNSDLFDFMQALCSRSASDGIDDAFLNGYGSKVGRRWKPVPGKTIKVRLVLEYPLVNPVSGTVDVSTKRFGEIFGVAHDMYRAVYERDDAERGGKPAPRVGKVKLPGMKKPVTMLNRRPGKLVWGHDMSDLAFESMHFEFSPEARVAFDAYQKGRDAALKKLKLKCGRRRVNVPGHPELKASRALGSFILRRHPVLKVAKLAFNVKKHVVGTVTFGIGS